MNLSGDKTPAKEHAAVWVPDSEAQFCMHCLKAKFTTMNRRVKQNSTTCTVCILVSAMFMIYITIQCIKRVYP